MKRDLVSIYLLIFLFGCSDGNQIEIIDGDHLTRKRKNEKDILVYEQQFIKKGAVYIPDGYLKEYYDNGKIKNISFFKNGELHGVQKEYFQNGIISHKYTYVKGYSFGPQSSYYSSGNLKWYIVYQTPKYFSDTIKGREFAIHFDQDNNVDLIEGHPLTLTQIGEKATYNVSDSVKLIFSFIESPDNAIGNLVVEKTKGTTTDIDTFGDSTKIDYARNHFTFYNYSCKNGNINYKAVYTLHDNETKKLIVSDTVICKIKVLSK